MQIKVTGRFVSSELLEAIVGKKVTSNKQGEFVIDQGEEEDFESLWVNGQDTGFVVEKVST